MGGGGEVDCYERKPALRGWRYLLEASREFVIV